jgi:hypothetical protein
MEAASSFLIPGVERRSRRRLERPFGSVRWRADAPDPGAEPLVPFTP